MLTRLHITILVGLAAAVWGAALFATGIPLTLQFIAPFGLTIGALSLLCLAFDKWCWSWSVFRGWLVHRPHLHGTWKVSLQSSWIDPATSQPIPAIDAYMVFRQTLSSLSIRLYTRESSSVTLTAAVSHVDDAIYRVAGFYQNDPSPELRGVRSEIHYGALLFNVHGNAPQQIDGHYFTDRSTKGTLVLTDRRPTLAGSFAEASWG